MKKPLIIISAYLLVISCNPQHNIARNILSSKDIQEIENYLRTAHPDDPKRKILKSKLIALKNFEWTKGKKYAKPMKARPIIYKTPNNNKNLAEIEEFKRLIALSSKEHKEKTVKLLSSLFNEDIKSKETIILFRNQSDCNLVVKIQGKDFYTMAVPANDENAIVVNKGKYTLTSNVCSTSYSSKKNIGKSILITIKNPAKASNLSRKKNYKT